jgi:hypothetical protein
MLELPAHGRPLTVVYQADDIPGNKILRNWGRAYWELRLDSSFKEGTLSYNDHITSVPGAAPFEFDLERTPIGSLYLIHNLHPVFYKVDPK